MTKGIDALNASVAAHVAQGWRVEMQTGTNAVLVSGKKPNHLLHLILFLATCGLWGLIWILVAATTHESRLTLTLGTDGVVRTSAPRDT